MPNVPPKEVQKWIEKMSQKDVNLNNKTLQALMFFLCFQRRPLNILRTSFLNNNSVFTFQQREELAK